MVNFCVFFFVTLWKYFPIITPPGKLGKVTPSPLENPIPSVGGGGGVYGYFIETQNKTP